MEPLGSGNKNVKRSDFNLKVSLALFCHYSCHGAKLLVIGDLISFVVENTDRSLCSWSTMLYVLMGFWVLSGSNSCQSHEILVADLI